MGFIAILQRLNGIWITYQMCYVLIQAKYFIHQYICLVYKGYFLNRF